jgi:hypothetical protein
MCTHPGADGFYDSTEVAHGSWVGNVAEMMPAPLLEEEARAQIREGRWQRTRVPVFRNLAGYSISPV